MHLVMMWSTFRCLIRINSFAGQRDVRAFWSASQHRSSDAQISYKLYKVREFENDLESKNMIPFSYKNVYFDLLTNLNLFS